MKNIELLKRLVTLSEQYENFEELNFKEVEIKINSLLETGNLIKYSLNTFNVPFKIYTSSSNKVPEEINVTFEYGIDFKTIFFLTEVFKVIYNDEIDIYIKYGKKKDDILSVFCGTYIVRSNEFTNISKPIKPEEILKLNPNNTTLKELNTLFPNINFHPDGICMPTSDGKNYEDYEHEDEGTDDAYYASPQAYGAESWDELSRRDAYEGYDDIEA